MRFIHGSFASRVRLASISLSLAVTFFAVIAQVASAEVSAKLLNPMAEMGSSPAISSLGWTTVQDFAALQLPTTNLVCRISFL